MNRQTDRPVDLPTTQQLANERRRLRYKSRYNRTLRSTVAILLVVAALAVLIAMLWMPVLRIYGSSLAPTLQDGQIVVCVKSRNFEPGDIDAETKSFFDLDDAGVSFVFNLNFLGTLLPTQAFARQMVGREGCSILNISSMNAYTPLTKIPAYSGAKAAVSNFTQWLAVHFSKVGIRVNAIAPGFFCTNQNAALLFNEDGTPTARTGKILAATPMGRFGKPEELEGAVLFLLNNEAAGFITGVVLPIDGGFSAYSGV